jgi:hypothetical protein
MRDNGRSDNGTDLDPGRIPPIEQAATGSLSALARAALAGADVVLYDRVLAPIVSDLLPRGSYAEPLTPEAEDDAPAISRRALKLASEGWCVVQLVRPGCGWRSRLRRADEALRAQSAGESPAIGLELVDGSAEDELLTLIVRPLATRASPAAYAFAANGLAG